MIARLASFLLPLTSLLFLASCASVPSTTPDRLKLLDVEVAESVAVSTSLIGRPARIGNWVVAQVSWTIDTVGAWFRPSTNSLTPVSAISARNSDPVSGLNNEQRATNNEQLPAPHGP